MVRTVGFVLSAYFKFIYKSMGIIGYALIVPDCHVWLRVIRLSEQDYFTLKFLLSKNEIIYKNDHKTVNKMAISVYLSIITFNGNGLNAQSKDIG